MLDDKKQPDVEIVDDPASEPDGDQQVTIDLDKKADSDNKSDQQKQVVQQPSDDLKKLHNTIAYQTRKLDQAMRELQEVRSQLASRKDSTVQHDNSQNLDDIDEIAQKDWKLGVKKVVEKDIETKVSEILAKRDAAVQEATRRSSLEQELEKSKLKVISRYPAIEDDSTDEAALYRQVVNEEPSLLSNVHGPEIAMYRMEERMREMGKTPSSVRPLVDREVNRLVRAGASSVIGHQVRPNGKITLSKDQKEFCDHYKIPYEQYAKNLKAQEANGGVEA